MEQPQQGQGIHVDPVAAFEQLQQYHGLEMGRLAGDIAAKNAYIGMLQKELQAAQERITAMEQNEVGKLADVKENGARQGGADLSKYPMPVKAPKVIRSLEGDQRDG